MSPAAHRGGLSGVLLLRSLLIHSVWIAALFAFVLGLGQLGHVGELLVQAHRASCVQWGTLALAVVTALGEAALPIVALGASALVYGRLHRDGAHLAFAALGRHPISVLWPAGALGLFIGALSVMSATTLVPESLVGVRGLLVDAARCTLSEGEGTWPLPQGGTISLRGRGEHREIWAVWSRDEAPPTLARARQAQWNIGVDESTLILSEAHLWGPQVKATVGEATVILDAGRWSRKLKMLGPPNALPSDALDLENVHHHFVWHRRLALPSLTPLWALLGAVLGLWLGAGRGLLGGLAVVALAHGLMRSGELSARFSDGSPVVAAWAPVGAVLVVLWLWSRWLSRPR
ncbi:MAG: LptF/LptG family permease [Bradymonadia bacterium]